MAFLPQLEGHSKTNTTQHCKLIFKTGFGFGWFFLQWLKFVILVTKSQQVGNAIHYQQKSRFKREKIQIT